MGRALSTPLTHKLKGSLDDLHSVSITLSYRITLDFLIAGKTV
jgi:hypothetical protein